MRKQFSEEEIVDYICEKLKVFLLSKEIFRETIPNNALIKESSETSKIYNGISSHFDSYLVLLRISDIADATQYSCSTIYEMIKQIEIQVPGSVYRRGEKGIRINQDKFFEWFTSQRK